MDMIVDVASNYKRQKIGEVAAVRRIQEILDIVASSDSEEPVRCGAASSSAAGSNDDCG